MERARITGLPVSDRSFKSDFMAIIIIFYMTVIKSSFTEVLIDSLDEVSIHLVLGYES